MNEPFLFIYKAVLVEHVVDPHIRTCIINCSPVFCFAFSLRQYFRRLWLCLPVGLFFSHPTQFQSENSESKLSNRRLLENLFLASSVSEKSFACTVDPRSSVIS